MTRETSKRRLPRRATPKSLENAALFHLARYASSTENLRRVLMRRVERSARAHDTDIEEGAAAVVEIVARFASSGLVDDAVYALARARGLFRRGASARKIRHALAQKGVGEEDIDAALAGLADEASDPDLAAALILARRRRLGPFGAPGGREERRQKDLAVLARAGFSYQTARRVIEAEDVGELEGEAGVARSSG